MAEVVHRLSHEAAAVSSVCGHLGHDEIGLAQRRTFGVDADEYFRHLVDVKRVSEFDDADLAISYAFQPGERLGQFVQVDVRVVLSVFVFKCTLLEVRLEQEGYIRYPTLVFQMRGVLHGKAFVLVGSQRVKSDFYSVLVEVLIENLFAGYGSHERGNALLAVDQHFFAISTPAVFRFDVRVLPGDDVARWITLIQRIDQIAHLAAFPDKWALDFGYDKVLGVYHAENRADGVLHKCKFFAGHCTALQFSIFFYV